MYKRRTRVITGKVRKNSTVTGVPLTVDFWMGQCRCVARNAVTSKERRSSVGKLSVVDRTTDSWRPREVVAPPPLTPSTSFLWALEGSDVTLECAANGQPQPVSWWTFNGADLVTGGAVVVRPGYLR